MNGFSAARAAQTPKIQDCPSQSGPPLLPPQHRESHHTCTNGFRLESYVWVAFTEGHIKAESRGFGKSGPPRPRGSRVVRHSVVPPYIATSTSGVTSNLHNAGSDSNQMNLLAPGVALTGGHIKAGNLGFWKSVWPRAAGEPVKKISGYVPILFERVPGRPGRASQNPGLPVSVWSPRIATPMCKQRTSLMR